MREGHRFAIGVLAAVLTVWLLLIAVLLRSADLPVEASGRVLAVYPFQWKPNTVLRAALQTDARLVSTSFLPNVIELASGEAGFAGRLRDRGAIAVYAAGSLSGLILGSCAGLLPDMTRAQRAARRTAPASAAVGSQGG